MRHRHTRAAVTTGKGEGGADVTKSAAFRNGKRACTTMGISTAGEVGHYTESADFRNHRKTHNATSCELGFSKGIGVWARIHTKKNITQLIANWVFQAKPNTLQAVCLGRVPTQEQQPQLSCKCMPQILEASPVFFKTKEKIKKILWVQWYACGL